jgi:hypothetical protein
MTSAASVINFIGTVILYPSLMNKGFAGAGRVILGREMKRFDSTLRMRWGQTKNMLQPPKISLIIAWGQSFLTPSL